MTGPQPQPQAFDYLVVIGSSAGGVEALSTLVATLPPDFPAPIVVAQHLDPRHTSHLVEILARRSTLPVRTVTDEEILAPGVVYVVPADRHVEVSDHAVRLRGDGLERRPKPSVDRLLRTAAEVFGERLIAVVLTGTGSDGASGAYAVKAAGGMVVIQNPATAAYPGMPASLAPTTVDVVADVERIGPLLFDLLTQPHELTQPAAVETVQTLLEQVREHNGVKLVAHRCVTATGTRCSIPYSPLQVRGTEESSPSTERNLRDIRTGPSIRRSRAPCARRPSRRARRCCRRCTSPSPPP